MKNILNISLLGLLLLSVLIALVSPPAFLKNPLSTNNPLQSKDSGAQSSQLGENLGKLPISFVPNKGQNKDGSVKFQASHSGGGIFFKPGEFHLVIDNPSSVTNEVVSPDADEDQNRAPRLKPPFELKVKYKGFNKDAQATGTNELPGKMNYFIGSNQEDWFTGIETYGQIAYQEFYPGINLLVDGTGGQLKTSFVVSPNADPSKIQWKYDGAENISIDDSGNLLVLVEKDEDRLTVKEAAPLAWQIINGEKVGVSVSFAMDGDYITFALPNGYNPSVELVIDPTLEWATYLGTNGSDQGNSITRDSLGNIIIGGYTYSATYPTTCNALQPTNVCQCGYDMVISKLDPTGTTLLYSTYLGTEQGSDEFGGLALDSSDNIIIAGDTNEGDFPIVGGIPTFAGGTCGADPCADIVVAKLNAAGSQILFSSYLGGTNDDDAGRVATGPDGKIYVIGRITSSDFPTTSNAYDRVFSYANDIGITKFNPSATGAASLEYSTYLNGNGDEGPYDIAVDSSNLVYVTGYTYSTTGTFPLKNAVQTTQRGSTDIFLSKFDMTQSGVNSLVFSTYIGGSGKDFGLGLDVDNSGNAYITGYTKSSGFATSGAFQTSYGGNEDAFAMKINTVTPQIVYKTYLGGSGNEEGKEIAVDSNGNAYVVGYTYSTNYPMHTPTQTRPTETCGTTPCQDAFLSVLNPTGSTLLFSTYLGGGGNEVANGVVVDAHGNAYVVGTTFSGNFPGTTGSYDPSNPQANTKSDIFVAKFSSARTVCGPQSVQASAFTGWSLASGNFNGDSYPDLAVGAPYYSANGAVFVCYGSPTGFSQTADLVLAGANSGDRFGWSVGAAGDVTGDGYGDLIVGAVGCGQTDEEGEGCAYVYSGSATGLSPTPVWSMQGNQAHAAYGYAVGGAGDVDGDGVGDVFVSAPNFTHNYANEGAVYVYLGATGGPSTTPGWTGEGGQENALFGLAVSSAGDAIRNDCIGCADLLVGAPGASSEGAPAQEGKAFIFAGKSGGLSQAADWMVEGNQLGAHLGEAVSSAGYLNDDGLGDVIVGAPDYDNGETDEGAVFVYLGYDSGLKTEPAWTGESNQAGASYGVAVASAGDVDGDGRDDVMVGANRFSNGEENEGKVYLYYGAPNGVDGTRSWVEEGGKSFANFGYTVATVGDVNGDSHGDFIIGANQMDNGQVDEGQVILFFGK